MRIVLFYHSLLSDWNHGNAHFLRGVLGELLLRGHDVTLYEPRNAWSLQNLRAEHGDKPIAAFRKAYPGQGSIRYDLSALDLDDALDEADLVIVHEWSDHDLVARVGQHRARRGGYKLLFHDTHHRAITEPDAMAKYDLRHYDGVLAFGEVLKNLYLARKWTRRAWTWHEAADTRVFRPIARPLPGRDAGGDVVWVGNWGDEERTAELHEFLLQPVKALGLDARVHGVRYPDHARASLKEAGIKYAGWLPNFAAPETFARFKVTVHVPRRPYAMALPGIPTIRVFEALACGIPLISAPWQDAEHLFSPGRDFLVARNGNEMKRHLKLLVNEPEARRRLAAHGHRTILSRHTCAHRVDELMEVVAELQSEPRRKRTARPPRARRAVGDPKVRSLVRA
ncbi:MAG TPA: glycosyltransferase [Tepidisphaeraceae bacterium]|nr:glycosyltransferase [Tepidisphaeraceae bacterium]